LNKLICLRITKNVEDDEGKKNFTFASSSSSSSTNAFLLFSEKIRSVEDATNKIAPKVLLLHQHQLSANNTS
jgi:hypothetical protein